MVETIMSLEDEFNIEISDRDAETLQTVGNLITLVRVKVRTMEARAFHLFSEGPLCSWCCRSPAMLDRADRGGLSITARLETGAQPQHDNVLVVIAVELVRGSVDELIRRSDVKVGGWQVLYTSTECPVLVVLVVRASA
jgi:hypothetical protein